MTAKRASGSKPPARSTGVEAGGAAGPHAMLDARVRVHTRGGPLTIAWSGGASPVMMKGPARTVFEGEWRY
jgi:diaminopimelate epimerase